MGTTGLAKGATLTHHGVINNAHFAGQIHGLHKTNHVTCAPPPFAHVFGTLLTSLFNMMFGLKMVVPSPSFEPGPAIKAIHDEKCTLLYGTPTMLVAILHHDSIKDHDLSSLRSLLVGASNIPIETMKQAQRVMGVQEIMTAYGLTETSPVASISRPDDTVERRLGTVGKLLPHLEAQVIDPATQKPVPFGMAGEICLKGHGVMQGYWNEPEKTREAIDENGWFHTGDIATMDEEGYFRIISRIKDVIIRGGANVYPAEVENLLYTHPMVQEVQVIGVPDDLMGEEICAVILLQPGMEATESDVRDFCKGQVSHYKIPRYVRFVREFPMTVSGKIQKFKLREQLEGSFEGHSIKENS